MHNKNQIDDGKNNINDPSYFKNLFEIYYPILVNFSIKYLNNEAEAKDIVQQFFIKFWENRHKYTGRDFNKSFFYTSIKNACINHLEKKVNDKKNHTSQIPEIPDSDFFEQIVANEKEMQIFTIIKQLPPRCKEIFLLNRLENLTYKEIGKKLQISVKTVEAQMNTALTRIRENYDPEL